MRCKVGDIAVIVRCGIKENIGMMVEVIAVAPTHDFSLPDGARHSAADPGQWVVKTIGSPLIAPCNGGRTRLPVVFAVCYDAALRPIRPDADPVETEAEREVAA